MDVFYQISDTFYLKPVVSSSPESTNPFVAGPQRLRMNRHGK